MGIAEQIGLRPFLGKPLDDEADACCDDPIMEIAALKARVSMLEAIVTSLQHNVTPVTQRNDVTGRNANAERQRRYRERKKAL